MGLGLGLGIGRLLRGATNPNPSNTPDPAPNPSNTPDPTPSPSNTPDPTLAPARCGSCCALGAITTISRPYLAHISPISRPYLAHISQVRLLLRAVGALTLRLIRVGHGPLCE